MKRYLETDTTGKVVNIILCEDEYVPDNRYTEVGALYTLGIGYTYSVVNGVFVPPSPYPSWVLDSELLIWRPPVARPRDGLNYIWDEATGNWIEVVL
jgi:hypothetical protein